MSWLDRIKRGILGAPDPGLAPTVRTPVKLSERQRVIAAPAEFNRASRRAAGSSFRWKSPMEMGAGQSAPRYARRHGARVLATMGKRRTRRERREAARVIRALAPLGVKP